MHDPASCQLLSVCGCAASPNVECALRLDNLESKQTPSKKPGHLGAPTLLRALAPPPLKSQQR
jgi:hypothetical protein